MNSNPHGDISSQGAVYVFLASSFSQTFIQGHDIYNPSKVADGILQPQESYQWFGRSLLIIPKTNTSSTVLIIGAPGYHDEGSVDSSTSAVGRVYAYSWSGSTLELKWGVTGDHHAGRTGHALAWSPSSNGGILVISEPLHNCTTANTNTNTVSASRKSDMTLRSGRVLVIPFSNIQSHVLKYEVKELHIKDIANVEEYCGEIFEGRFGNTMTFINTELLAISAPLANLGAGIVYVYNINTHELVHTVSGRKLNGMKSKGRVGSSLAVIPSNSHSSELLYVGAPYTTATTSDVMEESGSVFILTI